MCVCVHNHWVPGRVAFRLKATPVKIRILYIYPGTILVPIYALGTITVHICAQHLSVSYM